MSLCESQENVNIYFVIPRQCSSEESCSNDMKSAYTSCVEQSLHPEWISENSCLKLTPVKKDVFVFSEFEGVAYEHLCNNKCVIVGPRCILTCLTEGISIPEGRSAIYTVGMRGLLISTTGFEGDPKKKITKLVEFMGGVFTNKLRQSVTHLVANSVLSEKYQKATEQGIPVMTEKWVLEVWEASKLRNVHATDEEFMNCKCPIFHNLNVTSSGLPHKERDTVKELVNSNGGEYSGKLIGDQTHVLVIQEPYGEKYKYASQWQLPCVQPSWIQDSVKNGYALPVEPYSVKQKQKSSTPVHDDPRLPNFSMISAVGFGPGTVDETAMNSSTFSVISSRRSSIGSLMPPKYMEVVNKLTLADAKKAGHFLDGCKVYLSGFSPDVCENLRRILNAGGATRFSVLSDPVSHIIVGDHVPEDVNYLKKSGIRPHVVTIEWLLESMKQRRPATEEHFLVSGNNSKPAEPPPSPLSKKGAHLLRRPSDVSSPVPLRIDGDKPMDKQEIEAEQNADVTIVHQYLNASQSEPLENYGKASGSKKIPEMKQNDATEVPKPNESSQSLLSENTTQSSGCPAVFKGLTFSTAGFTEEETQGLEEVIKEKGGRVVHRGFKGIPDYGIVPLEGERLYHTTNAVVTHLWVEDCYECGELVPVNYYHQPVSLDANAKPLKDCVIALTTYAGKEREFITSVAELLGARTQETFARVNNPEKGAIASTHLICPEPGSKKYLAAMKWNVPAVNHMWVLACAREGRCVDAEPYLVKEASNAKEGEESHSTGKVSDVSNHSKVSTPVALPKQMQSAEESKAGPPRIILEETVPSVVATRSSDSGKKSMGPPVTPKIPTTNERERRRTTGQINSPATPAGNPAGVVQNLGFSPFSQETPIRTLISSVTDNANATPTGWTFDPNEATPKPPNYMPTPETPYGQVFKPNPSPKTRKNWKRWIDSIPEFEKLEPEEKKRRLSTPLSEIKRQIWEKFGGIKIPRKLETEEVQQDENNSQASTYAGARALHFSPVAGTSRDTMQPESSSQAEKEVAQQDQKHTEATQNGPSAGINTQLHALGEILTVPVNSPRALLFDGGEETPNKVKNVDNGESKKTEDNGNLPASLEIHTDCVDWVDPAVSDEASQEVKQPPKIMLSNVEDRDSYVKMIMDLGGLVSEKTVFDPTATHLICGKPARSEKLLGSIASGKWVLHRSFIDTSCRAGTFVKEEDYEWGNPKAKELWSQLRPGSVDMALANAVYRWRCKLSGSNRGAFSGMRAIIHTNQEKAASFARLIKAGGGQVLDIRPPYKNPQGATHCFAELNKLNEPIDLEALVKNKVPCLPPLYLNNYLINEPPPDANSCVLPEYSRIMQQLDR